jgi:hypothetical protein
MLWTYLLIWLVTIVVVFIINLDKGLTDSKKYWVMAGLAVLLLGVVMMKNSGGAKQIKFNEV